MRAAASRPFVDRPVVDVAAATVAAATSAATWGLSQPVLLRRGMNALFTADDVVIRVGNATAHPSLAHELVDLLASHGIPTVAPRHGLTAVVDGFAVSGWRRIDATSAPIDWRVVGAAVRSVHELSIDAVPPGYPVPSPAGFPWWDFAGLLDEARESIDAAAVAGLEAAIERNSAWREDIEQDVVVCHGDVHPGNVLVAADGPLLIDWDLLCVAPRAWDHAMLTSYADRWGGAPHVYPDFAAGYGRSLADDRVARSIAELRNVAATLMRIRAGHSDSAAAAEAERRLRYWRGDHDPPVWKAQ
jgi:hypothetical protein